MGTSRANLVGNRSTYPRVVDCSVLRATVSNPVLESRSPILTAVTERFCQINGQILKEKKIPLNPTVDPAETVAVLVSPAVFWRSSS